MTYMYLFTDKNKGQIIIICPFISLSYKFYKTVRKTAIHTSSIISTVRPSRDMKNIIRRYQYDKAVKIASLHCKSLNLKHPFSK